MLMGRSGVGTGMSDAPGALRWRGVSMVGTAQVRAVRVERPVVPCAGGRGGGVGNAPARHRGPPQERRHLAQGIWGGRPPSRRAPAAAPQPQPVAHPGAP